AFMVTFVENEGRLEGTQMEAVERLNEAAGEAELTVAGGISTVDEIARLHEMGVDAQVGMALYKDRLHLADAIAAPLESDREDGLWPTVVCDEHDKALGLAYSDGESLREAVDRKRGAYHSRSRGLWVKGETSGNVQHLRRIDLDCDADALRFTVEQEGEGFCHRDTWTCWGEDRGLSRLERIVEQRRQEAPEGSYTKKLFEHPELLTDKLLEEAAELGEADEPDAVVWEAADLLYFAMVAMAAGETSLREVEDELTRRMGEIEAPDED
ncbi:MAG: phosphoribosyl-ATP diphosphatase, partial [Bradymonadaceae bacterium]